MNGLQIMMMGDNSTSKLKGLGLLYNGNVAYNSNFAPTDYRVPNLTDYNTLETTITAATGGGKLKETGLAHWNNPNTGALDTYGFKAIGHGFIDDSGLFSPLYEVARYWLSTAGSLGVSLRTVEQISYNNASISDSVDPWMYGHAIRLVYTGIGTPTSVNDYDGNSYNVVQIGSQYWVAENWKCTHLNDGTALTKVTDSSTWASKTYPSDLCYCAYNFSDSYI